MKTNLINQRVKTIPLRSLKFGDTFVTSVGSQIIYVKSLYINKIEEAKKELEIRLNEVIDERVKMVLKAIER